ncbi:epoxyqueuosine reductase [Fuchsiella alkaliacetigena]|uniref:epoxyqueuosine reductase n=1 Tax=Fuchsiella alkaliacetigena TaxID=957042 RepID=UPI00200A927D|nr:epoxyqueuosine reductase [Fuchsiella alkaliacetigena]MCK8823628.1 epoxyqueuosine reductase [Fuchsiella alkaliacetigena]
MKKVEIKNLINQYVKEYSERKEIESKWREPIVKFANANDEMFIKLKEIVSPTHALPEDFLDDAKTVIVYFLPFDESVVNSNLKGKYSSEEWAKAYIETNQLILNLNNHIKKKLSDLDYRSTIIPATHNFDEGSLISDWSHRHVGYIAGLGKFALNNMLITDKGCCGRIGSIVINLKIKPSQRVNNEYCLYKSKEICKKCVQRCVNNALKVDSFDSHKCYEILLYNDELHSDLELTDACGKCCVNLPCSFTNPVDEKVK